MLTTVIKILSAAIVLLEGLYVAIVILLLFVVLGNDELGHSGLDDGDWYVLFAPFLLGSLVWIYAASVCCDIAFGVAASGPCGRWRGFLP